MLRDHTSLCSRFLPTRAVWQIASSLVCATGLLCGCASSGLMSAHLNDDKEVRSQDSTIRSQDAPLSNEWIEAPSGDFSARTPKLTQLKQDGRAEGTGNAVSAPAAGHSFAQPKARLGRPIVGGSVPIVGGSVPIVGGSVPAIPAAEAINAKRPELPQLALPDTRTSVPQRASWEPVPQDSPVRRDSQPAPAGSFSSPIPSQRSLNGGYPGPGHSPSTPDSQFPEVPLDSNAHGSITELPGGGPDESLSNAEATALAEDSAEATALPVPTMLDRLRGLYNPRIDENTDKLKKQIRRFPDPFGLLSDRESAEPLIPSEAETPPVAEAPKSADAAAANLRPSQSASSAVQTAITELEQQLAAWPRTPSGSPQQPLEWRQRQTDLRLLYMIAGRSAESIRVIEALPEEEQEYWQSLMLSMTQYRQAGEGLERTEQLTESLDHLRMAARKLQPLSQLAIRRMMLCDRIDGFGSVVEFPTSTFEPGQRILVYAELQNFQSELTAEGKYRSEFAAFLEFMREGDDEIVDSIRVAQIEDLCDVERTDYFQSFELTLPALEGKYLMRIRLRDQLSLQTAESQLEFTVQSRN